MPKIHRKKTKKKININQIIFYIFIGLGLYFPIDLLFKLNTLTKDVSFSGPQDWPPISMPEDVQKTYQELDLKIKIPQIPPLLSDNPQDPAFFQSLRNRTVILIKNHPVKEVREELMNLALTGQVYFSFKQRETENGSFFLYERKEADYSPLKGAYIPTINIAPKTLVNLDSEVEIYLAMFVIYHEKIHYNQRKVLPNQVNYYSLKERCELHFRAEAEAYYKSCILNVQLGISDFFCDSVNYPPLFWQNLFYHLAQTENVYVLRICIPYWAKIAGHPHPEAFGDYEH